MIKQVRTPHYNYDFDTTTGYFARWGATKDVDPCVAPAPEILDLEISEVCHGLGNPCPWCYKSNTAIGRRMDFDTFRVIIDKMPPNLTQVAFGIGDIYGHDDMWRMFDYCRNSGRTIIPNVTTNGFGLTDEIAAKLKMYCGAVAVSRYGTGDTCYNAVQRLTNLGMAQVNIHMLVAKETLADCIKTIDDIKIDPRLAKLNAIVFLTLKNKGMRNTFHTVDDAEYATIVNKCLANKINFGFDSCSANRFLRVADTLGCRSLYSTLAEPCESTLFSSYINVDGKFFPCSFTEGCGGWRDGLDVLACQDFVNDIWNHPRTLAFRSNLLQCGRDCPLYKI